MSKTIDGVPRELIEWIFGCTVRSFFLERHDKLKELRALLAAPVVERQAEPVCIYWDAKTQNCLDYSPPAPIAVVLPKDPEKSFLEWASTLPSPPRCLQSYLAAIDKVKELNQ